MDGLPITPGQRKKLVAAGISPSRVSNWKMGVARPNKDVAPLVARILRMSVRKVMDIQSEPPGAAA